MTFASLTLPRRDLSIVFGLFALSRFFYAWLGVRFDASTFPTYMQFIEPSLLTHRLLESLWYYHAGPPMLNLAVGIALKFFGPQAMLVLALLFHVLGLLLAVAVYALTCRLSHSRLAGLITAGLLVFSPAFVLYENWLMYSFPAATLLTLSALALYQYVYTRRTGWCVTFFALLAALLLTRSLFHLAWMVLVVGLLAGTLREHWRQVLRAALVPLLVVVLWYGKNYYLFGMFGSSSWMGLGLSNIATLMVTQDELRPLVEDGRLSRYALVSRYAQIDELFDAALPPTGVPVLDQVAKSTGQYNFNYHGIIEVDRHYTHDALTVIRTYPFSYVIGMTIADRLFFSPTSMNVYFSKENREAVRPMEALFNPLLYGVGAEAQWLRLQPHFGFENAGYLEVNTSVPLILAWIVALGYGYLQLRKAILSGAREALPRGLVIGFIVLTAVYIYAISTTIELAENYRYRSLIEPLFLVLEVSAITALLRKVRARFFPTWSGAPSMSYVDPSLSGVAEVSRPWTLSRSVRIALISAAVVAVPGLILYSQLFARFVHALAEAGVTPVAADRDFVNYWMGARLVLSGQHLELFEWGTYFPHLREVFGPDTPLRNWSYPPHFLLLIWPLGWLDYEPAMLVFLAVTFALFVAAALVFRRSYAPQSDWRILALAMVSFGMMMIDTAQNGFLTAALMLFGLTWRKQRPVLAGLAFALLTIKPQLGLLIPVLLAAERRWTTVAWSAAWTVGVVVLSSLVFGVSSWSAYLTATVDFQRIVMVEWHGVFLSMMPTVFGSVRALGFLPDVAFTAQWPISLAGAAVLIYLIWIEKDEMRRAFLAVVGAFIISPYAFNYDMGALAVVAALLVGSQELRRSAAIAVGAMTTAAAAVMYVGMASMPLTPLLLMFGVLALALDSRARASTQSALLAPTTS